MTRLAIFDCDGTLVDSIAPIAAAMSVAFVEAGLPAPSRAAVREIVGLSVPQAVAALAPAADADAIAATYKTAFRDARAAGRVEEPLYDGIVAVLDAFAAAGWLLGIATGKSDRGLAHCLATHGLADRFVTLQTADRHPSKPHPAMLAAALGDTDATASISVMIGDTAFDMAMARAAGVRAIGVGWGYHAPARLRDAGAACVCATPRDLALMA